MENGWKNLKVLVVEDSKATRHVICNMLRAMGVRHIFEAEDGRQALEFRETSFDLVDVVICDWNMPDVNGIDVLKSLRGTALGKAFLMITGRSDAKSVLEAKAQGVTNYIVKPFNGDQLQTKIAAILARKHVCAETRVMHPSMMPSAMNFAAMPA